MIPDEPNFARHLAAVIEDVADRTTDPDDALSAILEHPVAKVALRLTVCPDCGKPKGYRGYLGAECQCGRRPTRAGPAHSAGQTTG